MDFLRIWHFRDLKIVIFPGAFGAGKREQRESVNSMVSLRISPFGGIKIAISPAPSAPGSVNSVKDFAFPSREFHPT